MAEPARSSRIRPLSDILRPALFACLIVTGLASLLGPTLELGGFPAGFTFTEDPLSAEASAFLKLKKQLGAPAVIGYTDGQPSAPDYRDMPRLARFYRTQHAMAPWVLDPGGAGREMLLDCTEPAACTTRSTHP